MTEKNSEILKYYISEIENEISKYLIITENNQPQSVIINAMKHSISAGGKRIRPVLVLEFCKMCGGDIKKALPVAAAVEMLHTFSLIHDDLPCMDNDDFRRGKPSCHKAFDEAAALLAGDALQNLAYEIIAECNLKSDIKVRLIKELTFATGIEGMIGGQILDMEYEKNPVDSNLLKKMYSLKTGALLKAACKMGCIAAEANGITIENAEKYAENLGLAFQITDDILDITGNQDILGKPVGSDEENGKITYASLVGIEKSQIEVEKLTEKALIHLDFFKDNLFLKDLTVNLAVRKN
ncbi:MAG TPA: polyprenyl synthetase family protein [Oscillospiraceae bacterium]|nr:polyprenyl synthetase family protein [Oscillospiraceae bacterium]